MSEVPWAALAPVFVLLLTFVIWCWVDISRNEVKYLPKWLWVIICVVSIPLGGIVYLLVGRQNSPIR